MAAVLATTPLLSRENAARPGITAIRGLRRLHSGPVRMRLSASPSAAHASYQPEDRPLDLRSTTNTLTFTDSSSNRRGNYVLEKWYKSEQPVVYLGQIYRGYELLRRVGDWCWLTKTRRRGRRSFRSPVIRRRAMIEPACLSHSLIARTVVSFAWRSSSRPTATARLFV